MLHCGHTFLSFLSIGNKENRDQKRQRRDTQACPAVGNHVGYAHAPDMTRARQRSLPAMARAPSIPRWLFRLFSRHISGTQSFQENCHININVLVAQKPLVPLIGRLVACSARTRTDRQTNRPSTVTLAAHARRGLIMVDFFYNSTVHRLQKDTYAISKATINVVQAQVFSEIC